METTNSITGTLHAILYWYNVIEYYVILLRYFNSIFRQLWNKYMLEKHYQYAQRAFPSLTEGSEFFPLWTAIGGHGYLKDWFSQNRSGIVDGLIWTFLV